MPFAFPSESAFAFAGILSRLLALADETKVAVLKA
jgi:hypothetical protein